MTFSPAPEEFTSLSANPETTSPVVPAEGWNVLHLFYSISHGVWREQSGSRQRQALSELSELVAETRSRQATHLLLFSMVTPKADLGVMLLTEDLHFANTFEKRMPLILGADVLEPAFGYYSLTELSEYTTTAEEYGESLTREQGIEPGTKAYDEALATFQARMEKYNRDRLMPNLPDWPVFCFYPMSKKRERERNWYTLTFEQRKRLMGGHARVGRSYAGRILQLITGSTGLDDAEWGVTLFAKDPLEIKRVVYEMRFDPVSAEYAEFGQFFIGLQLPLAEIFRRHQLLPGQA